MLLHSARTRGSGSRTLDRTGSAFPFTLNIDKRQSIAQTFRPVRSSIDRLLSSFGETSPTGRLRSSPSVADPEGELLKTTKSSPPPNRKTLICFCVAEEDEMRSNSTLPGRRAAAATLG